jgi:hypothetical protein
MKPFRFCSWNYLPDTSTATSQGGTGNFKPGQILGKALAKECSWNVQDNMKKAENPQSSGSFSRGIHPNTSSIHQLTSIYIAIYKMWPILLHLFLIEVLINLMDLNCIFLHTA